MANSKRRPGENTGNQGGIFQEMGAKGGLKPNFATVADNKSLPPTSKPKSFWVPVKTTPDSKR